MSKKCHRLFIVFAAGIPHCYNCGDTAHEIATGQWVHGDPPKDKGWYAQS